MAWSACRRARTAASLSGIRPPLSCAWCGRHHVPTRPDRPDSREDRTVAAPDALALIQRMRAVVIPRPIPDASPSHRHCPGRAVGGLVLGPGEPSVAAEHAQERGRVLVDRPRPPLLLASPGPRLTWRDAEDR